MLPADRIRALLAGMPPDAALGILAALEAGRSYEAARLAALVSDDGAELVASIIRERNR